MSETHANVAQTQTVDDWLGITTSELRSQLVSQATTIESLRTLLQQGRAEIDALRASDMPESSDAKENAADRNYYRIHDLDRRFRASELKNNRLAIEMHRLEQEKRRVESLLSTFKSRLSVTTAERDACRDQLSQSSEIRKKCEQQITTLTKMNLQLKDALCASESEKSVQNERIKDMVTVLEHESAVTDLTTRLGEALADCIESHGSRAKAERELEQFKSTNRALAQKLSDSERDSLATKDLIHALRLRNTEMVNECDSSRAEMQRMQESHRHDIEALEQSHSIAISLLEQSAASSLSNAAIAEQAFRTSQEMHAESVRECDRVKESLLRLSLKPPSITEGVNTNIFTVLMSTQTDRIVSFTTAYQQSDHVTLLSSTDKESVLELISCAKCKMGSPALTLFPCGHGACRSCYDDMLTYDETNLSGLMCFKCEDGLPITRISYNKPIESLVRLFTF